MSAPRVSVVTPVYNAVRTLEATVASVQAQTMPDWEMFLIDDGSDDGSAELARALADRDPRVHLLGWKDNRGAAEARNAGIRASRGRYIAFLDADDLWRAEKLAVQLDHMETTGAGFVFSAYRRMDAKGNPLGRVQVPERVTHAMLLRENMIGCLTAVYDTAHFGRVEMPLLRRRQDYGLWLRLLETGAEAHGITEVLADYRVGGGSLSSSRTAALAANWTLYREVAGLGRFRAATHVGGNAARVILRRLRARWRTG